MRQRTAQNLLILKTKVPLLLHLNKARDKYFGLLIYWPKIRIRAKKYLPLPLMINSYKNKAIDHLVL